MRQWESETYLAIRAKARAAGARIYFADESGLRSDHAGTAWTAQGETPVLEVTGRRFSVNMLSAVGTRSEFRFMLHDGTVTASVFREFLKRLLIGAEQQVWGTSGAVCPGILCRTGKK